MMAGKFLSICFALCTVALDAIHMQVGLHRHGAEEKTCQEVVMESMMTQFNMSSTSSQLGSSLLQSVSIMMEHYAQSHTTDVDVMSVNKEAEEQAAPVHICGNVDWQGMKVQMMHMLDAVCEKGTETEQFIMSEGWMNATNATTQELTKTVQAEVKGSYTAEQNSACQNFEPMKFIGLFGPDFGKIRLCTQKMFGFTDRCSHCVTDLVSDMMGGSLIALPFSCGMKCVSDKTNPACQSCTEKNMKKMGVCLGGENFETELPKEIMATFMSA